MFDTSKIGYSFPPFVVEIERVKIQELALAIGENNPVYQNWQAAQEAGFQDIPLLPTTGTIFLFWENAHFVKQLTELGIDFSQLLHREEEYEYLAPLYPGEILTGVMTVLDGTTRKGPHNTFINLVTLKLHYTNQQGQPVLIATTRLASR